MRPPIKKLTRAASYDEQQQHRKILRYLLESGLIEAKRECERRQHQYPDDFRKALVEKDGSIISRPISRDEAEILRDEASIPTIALVDELSAEDMNALADMYEGWAQSELTDSVNVARLLGWADGLRSLAATVGADYVPPETPGASVSLVKFMAQNMRR
ncbi:MAG: hypothetical protein Q7J32_02770 [Sphingomonadaceae bacterium]|nr:hypothetical protein [Sphingomonadaceae bacterium]